MQVLHSRERFEVVRVLVRVAQIVRSDTNSIQQEVSCEVRHLLLHLASAPRAWVCDVNVVRCEYAWWSSLGIPGIVVMVQVAFGASSSARFTMAHHAG